MALGLLAAGAAHAQDIYIGTAQVREGVVWLDRCDLGGNRYVLRDGEANKPVAALKAKLARLKAPVTVEVIGEYAQEGETNILQVIDIQNVQAGKSCHLLDMVDPPKGAAALFAPAVEAPAPNAKAFGKSLTARMGDALAPPRDYAKGPQRPDPADYDADTSGIIYDVAYGGADDEQVFFVIQGYSPGDLVNPASAQTLDFPRDARSVNVRDLEIRIEKADAEALTYRIKITPEPVVAAPNCPEDCQPSTVGKDDPPRKARVRR